MTNPTGLIVECDPKKEKASFRSFLRELEKEAKAAEKEWKRNNEKWKEEGL